MRLPAKIVSVIGLLLFLSGVAAAAAEMPRNVVYFDDKYPVKWLTKGASEEIRDFLVTLGLSEINAADLKEWMNNAISTGAKGTMLVMSQDVIPATVVGKAPGPDAMIRKYLDAGGTVVWLADVPFYFVGHADGDIEKWDYLGGRGILGFDTVGNWQGNSEAKPADTGAEWGLKTRWISVRAVKPADITKKLMVDADGNVSSWTKQYVEGSAGFVRLWDYNMKNFTDEMGQDLYSVISHVSPDFAGERKFGSVYLFKPSDYYPLIHRDGGSLVREVLVSVFDNSAGRKKYTLKILEKGEPFGAIPLFDDDRAFYKQNLRIPLRYKDQTLTLVCGDGGGQKTVGEVTLSEPEFFFELRWNALPARNSVDMGTVLIPGDTVLAETGQNLKVDISGTFIGAGSDRKVKLELKIVDRDKNLLSNIALDENYESGKFSDLSMEPAPGKLLPGKYRAEFTATAGGAVVYQEKKWIVIEQAPAPRAEFGAYEADLSYLGPVMVYDTKTKEWEKQKWDDQWERGPHNDIVVSFPNGQRFVFWRGASNVPFWVSWDNVGLTYEWMEAAWGRGGLVDCIEPLQDKECRYSRPYIVSSTPARAVIRWRYALADLNYTIADKEWGEEEYVFYPDAFGARKAVGHFLPMSWHEAHEFIVLTPAGVNPFDIFPEKAITILSADGKTKKYMTFPRPNGDWEKNAPAVFRVNYSKRDKSTPFMAIRKFDRFVSQYDGWKVDGRYISPSYWGVHYPVTRGYPTTIAAPPVWRDSAAHASLSGLEAFPDKRKTINKTLENVEWTWMIGNTDMPDSELLKRTANWIDPAPMKVLSGGTGGDYDPSQAGYVIDKSGTAGLSIQLNGKSGVTIPHLVLIVRGYDNPKPKVLVNGKKALETSFKYGVEQNWTQSAGVIWMAVEVPADSKIEIE
jgi:hypothetical protein